MSKQPEDQKIECPNLKTCPLFPLFSTEKTGGVFKRFYCESKDHVNCQRFADGRKGLHVPDNLLPNGNLLKFK